MLKLTLILVWNKLPEQTLLMAISGLPKELSNSEKPKATAEKKIQEFINKGGKPSGRGEVATASEVTKGMKITFTETELGAIRTLRDKRPRHRSRKIPISIHDWIIEAVHEKIQREQKQHGLTLL